MEENEQTFSSIDLVGQCLTDEERTKDFQKAIKKTVKSNHTVLDLGTGSGVMASFAAQSGAKKVVAVEYDPLVAKMAENTFKLNKLDTKISLLRADARKLSFDVGTTFDVVISEMLTTGVVDEHQVQAINNLHEKKFVNSSTIFLPKRQDTYVSLVNYNSKLHGLKIAMILHLWNWHNWKQLKIKKITNQALLQSLDFSVINNENVDSIVEVKATKPGIINALYLTSISVLTDKISVGDTEALNAPMLIPIPDTKVKKGQVIKVRVSYIYGGGYNKFKAEIVG